MIGVLRIAFGVLFVGLATVPLAGLQFLNLKLGLFSEKPLPRAWHRVIVKALGFRLHVRGKMAKERPLLIAANHISWADIMVLGSIANVAFIAKADMARWPIMGWLATLQRTVYVERDRPGRSGDQAGEIGRRLAAGEVMVLFPEGSTGDGNFLLAFKTSLFGAASLALKSTKAELVHIQPVAISYTKLHGMPMGRRHRPIAAWIGDSVLLPHVFRLLRERAVDVEVAFGEPVAFGATSSRKEAARLVQERIRGMREEAFRRLRAGK
jgi:1-acyl-sn-glycerol-3-phosphate acyltransferase